MVASATRVIEPGIVERIFEGVSFIYVESPGLVHFASMAIILCEEYGASVTRSVYRAEDGHEFSDLSGFNLIEANQSGTRVIFVMTAPGKLTNAWRAL